MTGTETPEPAARPIGRPSHPDPEARRCRTVECTRPAPHGYSLCHGCRKRITRHGDPRGVAWSTTERRTRIESARRLTARRVPPEEIARIVGVSPRTVYRWRSKDRLAA